MTSLQKIIKYCAIAFAVFLVVCIIGGMITAAAAVFSFLDDSSPGKMTTYEISGEVSSLTLDIAAADIEILPSDAPGLKSNIRDLRVTEQDGVLTIEDSRSWFHPNRLKLTLYLPENLTLETVDITLGAGRMTADGLHTGQLRLELGAGQAELNHLTADGAKLNGGAGLLAIRNGSLNQADLNIGAGKLTYQGTLSGRCSIDAGVGEVRLELTDDPQSYRFEVDKGLGSISVDGRSLADDETYGSGDNRIDLSSGIGSIKVLFDAD